MFIAFSNLQHQQVLKMLQAAGEEAFHSNYLKLDVHALVCVWQRRIRFWNTHFANTTIKSHTDVGVFLFQTRPTPDSTAERSTVTRLILYCAFKYIIRKFYLEQLFLVT